MSTKHKAAGPRAQGHRRWHAHIVLLDGMWKLTWLDAMTGMKWPNDHTCIPFMVRSSARAHAAVHYVNLRNAMRVEAL